MPLFPTSFPLPPAASSLALPVLVATGVVAVTATLFIPFTRRFVLDPTTVEPLTQALKDRQLSVGDKPFETGTPYGKFTIYRKEEFCMDVRTNLFQLIFLPFRVLPPRFQSQQFEKGGVIFSRGN